MRYPGTKSTDGRIPRVGRRRLLGGGIGAGLALGAGAVTVPGPVAAAPGAAPAAGVHRRVDPRRGRSGRHQLRVCRDDQQL